MKIKSIEPIGKKYVYDIETESHSYVLANGVKTHNSGALYSADDVFIVGKRQVKDGSTLVGWQFILNVEKSRSIREKSAIPFEVTYEGGIDTYSGLLDIALITGHVTRPKMGWYTRPMIEGDKNWRKKDTSTKEFWDPLLSDESFKAAVHDLYKLNGGNQLLQQKMDAFLVDEDTGEIIPVDVDDNED